MKKYLLFFYAVMIAGWCQAQSLQLSSYTISITGDNDSLLHSTAILHNVGSTAIDVRVDRTVDSLAPSHYSYFCWAGTCYGPATSTSPFVFTMAPGDSSPVGPTGFIAYLQPAGALGSSEVTYCFYDDLNLGDSVCITFNYNSVLLTTLAELIASGMTLTNPFPNPANVNAQIGFNLVNAKNAKLIIYNMLGSVVKEIKVADKQKLLTLSTAEFKNGIYIYSLMNDDKLIASKKLVVNHR